MKILIINFSDVDGGAARAAYRLHTALLKSGIDSLMLVCKKYSDDPTVIGPVTKLRKGLSLVKHILDQLPLKFYKAKSKTMFSTAWLPSGSLVKRINRLNPDIIHLHWINNGMLNIKDLLKINAPIVWSLHDMWAFTGGCHYDEECGLYVQSCGTCKVLKSSKDNDLSWRTLKRKENTFSNILNLHAVGLSKWITISAKESTLFKEKNVINLPNLIDTDLYKPIEKNYCRNLYNLPYEKKLVLYGAMGATSDPRKGYIQILDALKKIDYEELELVVFGGDESQISKELNIDIYFISQKKDDESLVALYNTADVVVVPSIQENLSNVIMESLACGTPVVAFDVGGNSDMVEHKQNGYLADPFDTADLAKGIEWVLQSDDYQQLSESARKKVINSFSEKTVVGKYTQLYKQIL